MIKVPYEDVVAKISHESGLSEAEVQEKIDEKLGELSGLVSKEGAAHIVANELGVKVLEQPTGKVAVDKILPGMRSVTFTGKVQRIFDERSFDKGTRKGKVRSFIAGDETGTIRVVLWNDQVEKIQTLKEGDVVSIQNGYVKENNNQKEVHLNDKSGIELNPPGENIGEVKVTIQQRLRKRINELSETDSNVELLGTIVQVFEPRYFETCPECNKRARMLPEGLECVCEAHGKVIPKYSYVMNLIIDDGSGTIRTVFFKNQADNLAGKGDDFFMSIRSNPEKIEQLKNELLGEIVKIVGRATKNAMFDRLEFVSQLVFRNPNPEEELKRLS